MTLPTWILIATGACTPTLPEGAPAPPAGSTDTGPSTEDTAPPVRPDTGTAAEVGRTYRFDRDTLDVTPEVVDLLVLPVWETPFLVQVLRRTDTAVDLRIGTATDLQTPPTQDRCIPTTDLLGGSPDLSWSGAHFELHYAAGPLGVQDAALSGTFTDAGDRIVGGTVDALVDTVGLVDAVAPGGGDDAICELIADFGLGCVPCPDGGTTCVAWQVEDAEAEWIPSLELEARTAEDIAADPACQ